MSPVEVSGSGASISTWVARGASDTGSGSGSGSGAGLARLGRRAIPPDIATVSAPMPPNHRKIAGPKVAWSTPTSPKLPSRPLPACRQQRHGRRRHRRRHRDLGQRRAAAVPAAAHIAVRPRHRCRSDDQQRHPYRAEAGRGRQGGEHGQRQMRPPNTVNELNVASPTGQWNPPDRRSAPGPRGQ